MTVFLRPEDGTVLLSAALQFNWGLPDVFDPTSYQFENSIEGVVYGEGIYDTSLYASSPTPVVVSNVEGSGESCRITFSSYDQSNSYSIQAVIFEMSANGRK